MFTRIFSAAVICMLKLKLSSVNLIFIESSQSCQIMARLNTKAISLRGGLYLFSTPCSKQPNMIGPHVQPFLSVHVAQPF